MVSCNHILHSWMPWCLLPLVPDTVPCHEVNSMLPISCFLPINKGPFGTQEFYRNSIGISQDSVHFSQKKRRNGKRIPRSKGGLIFHLMGLNFEDILALHSLI